LIKSAHQGPSRARNLGTEHSGGQFIQYLDADDVLADGKLHRQVQELERTGADVAYGGWREFQTRPDGSLEMGRLVEGPIPGNPEIALFTGFWCPPAAYLFRREIVRKLGGWNERLPIIQDARFVLDCALHGARFAYCPGVSAYYRRHSAGSVSTRDPVEFARDCLRNAVEVERWWSEHGAMDPEHLKALTEVYGFVARASFGQDRPTFEAAYAALEKLQPGYKPSHPRHLALASRLLGYRRAEGLAASYRQAKKRLRLLVGGRTHK
jgi:glycosyltransferase involved in cell wall biosynthesis